MHRQDSGTLLNVTVREPNTSTTMNESRANSLRKIEVKYSSAIHLLEKYHDRDSESLRAAVDYILQKEIESPTLTSEGF